MRWRKSELRAAGVHRGAPPSCGQHGPTWRALGGSFPEAQSCGRGVGLPFPPSPPRDGAQEVSPLWPAPSLPPSPKPHHLPRRQMLGTPFSPLAFPARRRARSGRQWLFGECALLSPPSSPPRQIPGPQPSSRSSQKDSTQHLVPLSSQQTPFPGQLFPTITASCAQAHCRPPPPVQGGRLTPPRRREPGRREPFPACASRAPRGELPRPTRASESARRCGENRGPWGRVCGCATDAT